MLAIERFNCRYFHTCSKCSLRITSKWFDEFFRSITSLSSVTQHDNTTRRYLKEIARVVVEPILTTTEQTRGVGTLNPDYVIDIYIRTHIHVGRVLVGGSLVTLRIIKAAPKLSQMEKNNLQSEYSYIVMNTRYHDY